MRRATFSVDRVHISTDYEYSTVGNAEPKCTMRIVRRGSRHRTESAPNRTVRLRENATDAGPGDASPPRPVARGPNSARHGPPDGDRDAPATARIFARPGASVRDEPMTTVHTQLRADHTTARTRTAHSEAF